MNSLTSLINFKYMFQNIKKSKGVIILITLLVPIFTGLILLLVNRSNVNSSDERVTIISMFNVSIPTIIGLYIMPIILSIALFGFVHKKNRVDFIGSMPLKRSTIFFTNTLAGIIIFTIVIGITALIIAIGGAAFSNIAIAPTLPITYFITFLLSYIFVYTVANLSLTLTGNVMLQVVLTFFLLFFPGYMQDFYNSKIYVDRVYSYVYEYEYTYHEEEFAIRKAIDIDNSHTVPYKYARIIPIGIFGQSRHLDEANLLDIYSSSMVIKTVVLSFGYFALGMFLFYKRKMELAENTFLNEKIHNFVRCILLFPIFIGVLAITKNADAEEILIIFAVLTVVYYVYDLITKKSLNGFLKSSTYLVVLLGICVVFNVLITNIGESKGNKIIDFTEVKSIGIDLENSINKEIIETQLSDEAVINAIMNERSEPEKRNETYHQVSVKLTLKNNKSYYFAIDLVDKDYKNVINLLNEKPEFAEEYKEFNFDKVFAVTIGDKLISKEYADKIIEEIKKGLSKRNILELEENTLISRNKWGMWGGVQRQDVKLYQYEEGVLTQYLVNTLAIPEVTKIIAEMQNQKYIKQIINTKFNKEHLYLDSIEFNDEIIYGNYQNIDILENIEENIRNVNFDDTNNIVKINVGTQYGKRYTAYINKNEVIDAARQRLRVVEMEQEKYWEGLIEE